MITNLEDTLNMPVIHREFSRAFDRHWDGLAYAQIKFLISVFGYAADGQDASVRKRGQVGRRLDDITKAIRRSGAFTDKAGDANRSDQDRYEQDILASFLIQRAVPFVEFWQEAIEALDDGVSLGIKPSDIPVWFDEVPQ
jgi:hypothetical protein